MTRLLSEETTFVTSFCLSLCLLKTCSLMMGPEPEGADQNVDVDQEVVDEDVVDVDVVEEDPVAEAEEDHAVRYLDKFFECVLFVQNILN